MPVALETVVKQLSDSGIIAPGKLENFVPPKASPKDGEELLRELFKQNLLTKFQAQQVAAGKAKSLILGGYIILDKIGAGGMGQVFKAHHRRMERVVAIKMLPPAMTKDTGALARFQREVVAAAKLRHTNIVNADDAAEANGVHFLVMEYVSGQDLSALVKKNGPFSVEKAVDYILQAARGLEYAHRNGVIHRDIKPANLLLNSEGTVKILDMGLARIEAGGNAATQAELTGTGAIMGTVDYMAPEQALDTKHADARADIYSLGCSLYYLVAGGPVYGGETVTAKLLAHQGNPIPTLRALRDDVPEAVDVILERMLAKKPEDRYQSMSQVIADLQPLVGGSSTMTSSGTLATTEATTSNSNLTFLNEMPARHTQKKTEKQPKTVPTGTSNKRRRQIVIACAAGGMALVLLAAIIVIIRNRDGKEVARIEVPDGTVEVQTTPGGDRADGWVDLFNGQDTTGWTEMGNGKWAVVGGVLRSDTGTGWLGTDQEYDDFELMLEFHLPRGGNTGVFLRGWPEADPGGAGMLELQLVDDKSPALANNPRANHTMSIVSLAQPSKSVATTPDQWHSVAVKLKGTHIEGQFDGQEVLDAELAATGSTLPGLQRKSGRIGLQVKGARVEFRNIRVRRLSPKLFMHDPAFSQWMKDVHAMPAQEQIEAVRKKLTELNPGFDGKLMPYATAVVNGSPKVENGVVTELGFLSDHVVDISPVQTLPGLKKLFCGGGNPAKKARLSDLSPLAGMKLTGLICSDTEVADLSPLAGMPLISLHCLNTWVSDLTPLAGMPLTDVRCAYSEVSDLTPLKGMKLKFMYCYHTQVSDLTPLAGMPLTSLLCGNTRVSDLSPIKGIPLTVLACYDTPVSNLTPLAGMLLKKLQITPKNITRGMDVIQVMDSLEKIGTSVATQDTYTPAEFWKHYDAGEFGKPSATKSIAWETPAFQEWVKETQALPAEQQIEAVRKKLMELNPGFDGKLTEWYGKAPPKIDQGGVTELGFYTDFVTDLSPVRGLPGLKRLVTLRESGKFTSILTDLSPLAGVPLTHLNLSGNKNLSDLSPLAGLKLTYLNIDYCAVTDLSPLAGMPLYLLICGSSPITSLLPLRGIQLTELQVSSSKATDLSPLRGMPLKTLTTAASDLSPLFDCRNLTSLALKSGKIPAAQVAALQKALPNCKITWDDPAKAHSPQPSSK